MSNRTDDLWTPAPKPEPELLARQLAALRDWLERSSWSEREASCLIAGVLPPERNGDDRGFGAWLPGREVCDHTREAWRFKMTGDISHIETMFREVKAPHGQSPCEYLELAAKLGFIPPWLELAEADSESRKHLPPREFREQPKAAQVPTTQSETASLGGNAKRDKDPKRKRFLPIVRALVDAGKPPSEIIEQLAQEFDDEAPRDSTVYGWCKKIRDGAPGWN